jgi:D-alanyl-D-alanine carboxypeptidase
MVAAPAGVTNQRHYGLGTGVYPAAEGLPLGYGHDGYIPGYRSSLRFYPAAGIAIALQVNTEDGFWETQADGHLDFIALCRRISQVVLGSAGAGR